MGRVASPCTSRPSLHTQRTTSKSQGCAASPVLQNIHTKPPSTMSSIDELFKVRRNSTNTANCTSFPNQTFPEIRAARQTKAGTPPRSKYACPSPTPPFNHGPPNPSQPRSTSPPSSPPPTPGTPTSKTTTKPKPAPSHHPPPPTTKTTTAPRRPQTTMTPPRPTTQATTPKAASSAAASPAPSARSLTTWTCPAPTTRPPPPPPTSP